MNTEESVGKQLKQYNSVTITKVVRSDDICENQFRSTTSLYLNTKGKTIS